MKKLIAAVLAPLLLAAQPAEAQRQKENTSDASAQSDDEAFLAVMTDAFKTEPLTAEQQARLPQATAVVGQIMPEGTLSEIFGDMFDKMLGPILSASDTLEPPLAEMIGYSVSDLGITSEQARTVMAVIDPDWKERQQREIALVQELVGEMMAEMEPAMRRGMAEAYAVHFTAEELSGIEAFFGTDIGRSFARKSYKLSSDPRIMSAAFGEMPKIMAKFMEMESRAMAATADLATEKDFAALSQAERERILLLTGLSAEDLEAGMKMAAEANEAEAPF